MTEAPIEIKATEEKYKERILCTVLKKTSIGIVSNSSIQNALTVLKKNTLENIKDLRKIEITNENKIPLGRESAFYSQLYINALLSEI